VKSKQAVGGKQKGNQKARIKMQQCRARNQAIVVNEDAQDFGCLPMISVLYPLKADSRSLNADG
jgi:hypothetical protein